HALGADGAGARRGLEEHLGRVLIDDLVVAIRVGREPGADALHGALAARELPHAAQDAADAAEPVAILAGKADPQGAAFLERHLAGSLDLGEHRVDRIIDPDHDALLVDRRAAQLGAGRVGDQPSILDAAPDAPAGPVGNEV